MTNHYSILYQYIYIFIGIDGASMVVSHSHHCILEQKIDQNIYQYVVQNDQVSDRVLSFPFVNVIYFYDNLGNYYQK